MKKLYIIYVFFLIVLSSFAYAEYTDPVIVYDFNQNYNTTNLTNQVDNADNLSTIVDVSAKVTGIHNDAWYFNASSTDDVTIHTSSIHGMGAMAIVTWIKPESIITTRIYVCRTGAGHITSIYPKNTGILRYTTATHNTGEVGTDTSDKYYVDKWSMLVLSFDGVNAYFYHNGTFIGTHVTASTNIFCDDDANIGSHGGSDLWYDGLIDETYIYDHNLTQTDITALWNSGTGHFYPFEIAGAPVAPIIQPPSPADNANNNTNVTLNVSHSTLANDVRYYLYFGISSTLTENHLYIDNETRTGDEYKSFTTNVTDGTYYWKWKVQNITDGQFSINTTQRTLTIDTFIPTITLGGNHNISTDNTTIISNYLYNLSINVSFFDTNLYQTLINITNSTDQSLFQILNTSITGTTANYSRTIDITNWSLGNYILKLISTDSHTSLSISDYDVQNGINTLEFNTPEGNRIWISSDGSSYSTLYNKKKDRYEFGWNYLFKDTKRTFTIRAKNKIYYLPDSEYIGHFVILGDGSRGNWIDFEGIGKDYSVKKIKDNEYEITFVNLLDNNKIISKSLGGLNVWRQDYKFKIGAVYDIWVHEDENNNPLNATATLDSQFAHTISSVSPARLVNVTKENRSFVLNSTGYGSETKSITPTENYHNVTFNMTPTSAVKIYYYDESSGTLITGEIFSTYLETTGFSNTYSATTNPYTITGLPNGLYKLKASSTNYLERQYLDLNVSNVTTTILNIYLINSTLGSEVTFNIVSTDGLAPLEDVFVVFTRIINGTTTVIAEEESDYAGQVKLDLDSNYEYTINFSKTNYEDKTITLEPTESEYLIQMVSTIGLYNRSVHEGIRYRFEPSNVILNNNTKYNFTFTLNSTVWEITNCNLTLKNESDILSTTTSYTSTGCYLSIEYSTGNMTSITSEAIYELNNQAFTVSQQYSIIYTYEGEFSLKNFLDDLSDFSMAGFDNFGRMILAFVVIFVILAMASTKISFEHKEVPLFIFWALVGFFSYVNWFYLDLGTMPDLLGLKKWFIFYLVSLVCGGFIMNKMRK